jgi:uncharacterized protein YjbI with pentapeptide repeats
MENVRRRTNNPETWWPVGAVVAIWLAMAALLGTAVFLILGRLAGPDWYPWNNKQPPELFDVTRSTITATGLLGAAVIAAIAVRRQRSHEIELHNAQLTLENERDANATDRYTKAVEQLGHANVSVRLGGIYALERVSRDSTRDTDTISEVLSAFARRAEPTTKIIPVPTDGGDPDGRQAAEVQLPVEPDVEAAVQVLGRRKPPPDMPADTNKPPLVPARLSGAHLKGAYLRLADLEGADLRETNLAGADLAHANLALANLSRTDLSSANLSSCTLAASDLTHATLAEAQFRRSDLSGADLSHAYLGAVDLALADMRGTVLVRANMQGAHCAGTDLTYADLSSADLTGADLRSADLTGARLDGATLKQTKLEGALFKPLDADDAPGPPTGWTIGPDFRLVKALRKGQTPAAPQERRRPQRDRTRQPRTRPPE